MAAATSNALLLLLPMHCKKWTPNMKYPNAGNNSFCWLACIFGHRTFSSYRLKKNVPLARKIM